MGCAHLVKMNWSSREAHAPGWTSLARKQDQAWTADAPDTSCPMDACWRSASRTTQTRKPLADSRIPFPLHFKAHKGRPQFPHPSHCCASLEGE